MPNLQADTVHYSPEEHYNAGTWFLNKARRAPAGSYTQIGWAAIAQAHLTAALFKPTQPARERQWVDRSPR